MAKINTSSVDWARANEWRMKRFTGPKTTVPGGHEIDATEFLDAEAPGADDTGILDQPEKFLKAPKPGHAYVWRARSDSATERMAELAMIRLVTWDELKQTAATISVHQFQESGMPDATGARSVIRGVGWQKMALYEVSPELAYKWFKQPQRYALKLTTTEGQNAALEQSFADNPDVKSVNVSMKDRRTVDEEKAHDARN